MRRLPLLAATLLLLPLSGCNKLQFKEFSSPEGKFTILMPGDPQKKTETVMGITVTAYGVDVRNGAFRASSADLPPGKPFSLSGAVQGAIRPFSGKLLSEKDWSFEGSTGKEFEAEATSPKGYLSGRIIIINGRYFELMAMGSNARLSNPDVQTFLNSFKLTK